MKTFVLAPLLAAVAMFVCGALYWMSPFPYRSLGRVADDSAAAAELGKIFPATGMYLIPGAYLDPQTATTIMRRGPIAQVFFVKEGHAPIEPGEMVAGFIHYFVVALLLTLFLHHIRPTFKGYRGVVIASSLIGLIGAVLIDFSDPIWWHHPWPWHLVCALYNTLESVVAGLVLGAFLKPSAQSATPSSAA